MSPKPPSRKVSNPQPKIPTVRKRAGSPVEEQAPPPTFAIDADASTEGLERGIEAADYGEEDEVERKAREQEEADVQRRLEMIDESRAFDREAYAQMAKDRAYAAGKTNHAVSLNIIGTYIDNWVSLLYARNPDIDVIPEEGLAQTVKAEYVDFGKSLERVIGQFWKKGRMKKSAKGFVRTALTTYFGACKSTWQEKKGKDPQVSRELQDAQDNLKRVNMTIAAMEAGVIDETSDVERQQLEDTIRGLQGRAEVTLSQGKVYDQVDPADLTFSLECPSIARFSEGPWVSHRMFKTWRRFAAEAGITDKDMLEKLKAAATYYPKKQVGINEAALHQFTEQDVERYTGGNNPSGSASGASRTGFLCIEEMWDRDDGMVHTLVRGLKCRPIPAYAPDPSWSEFYPFHLLFLCEIDGSRWPDSLNKRSQPLQDDANSAFSGFSDHRKRIKPNMVFNAHQLSAAQIKKLVDGVIAEYIALKPVNPDVDIRTLFAEKKYPAIDMEVYSLEPILAGFELIWGLQEAATGTIDTPKTATEAEIEHSGTQSRSSDKRDTLEDMLSEIANQDAEYAVQKLDQAAVIDLLGEGALWPEDIGIDDLEMLCTVAIRAGSSGKPNLQAQRESWGKALEVVTGAVEQIAMLRGSSKLDVANCIEELVKETFARLGERVDISRFIPKVPDLTATVPGDPAATGAPGAPGGPAPVGPDGQPLPVAGDVAVPPAAPEQGPAAAAPPVPVA